MLFSELLKSKNNKLIKKILSELFDCNTCYLVNENDTELKVFFYNGSSIGLMVIGWINKTTEYYFDIPKYLKVLKNNNIEFDEKED